MTLFTCTSLLLRAGYLTCFQCWLHEPQECCKLVFEHSLYLYCIPESMLNNMHALLKSWGLSHNMGLLIFYCSSSSLQSRWAPLFPHQGRRASLYLTPQQKSIIVQDRSLKRTQNCFAGYSGIETPQMLNKRLYMVQKIPNKVITAGWSNIKMTQRIKVKDLCALCAAQAPKQLLHAWQGH